MSILNCIVYYDNPDEIDEYVNEVNSIANRIVDIAVTVNGNAKKSFDSVLKKWETKGFKNITVFDFKQNVGYLNAMLMPVKDIELSKYDYIILSNTDINYSDKAFFKILMDQNYTNHVGCIAPQIFEPYKNSYCNPHYRKRIKKSHYLRLSRISSNYLLATMYIKLARIKARLHKKQPERYPCTVYAPHGSYMIFTRDFISALKGTKYPIVLYSEEAFIGEMLQRKKYQCIYDPSLMLEHRESTVTGKINQKDRFRMWKESIDYILKEFY